VITIEEDLASHGISHEVGPWGASDQHGKKYIVLGLNGPTGELHAVHVLDRSGELTSSLFRQTLLAYIGDNKHVIFGVLPQLDCVESANERATRLAHYSVCASFTAYPSRP
jgi:hypothetical protein